MVTERKHGNTMKEARQSMEIEIKVTKDAARGKPS